jgi:hypothetical protein
VGNCFWLTPDGGSFWLTLCGMLWYGVGVQRVMPNQALQQTPPHVGFRSICSPLGGVAAELVVRQLESRSRTDTVSVGYLDMAIAC